MFRSTQAPPHADASKTTAQAPTIWSEKLSRDNKIFSASESEKRQGHKHLVTTLDIQY